MPIIQQHSFNGGEVSSAVHARSDIEKYGSSLKTCINWIIEAHGGASTRGGFQYCGSTLQSNVKSRLIPFERLSQTYILELAQNYMSPILNGVYLKSATKAITGATQANPCVVTCVAHGFRNYDMIVIAAVGGMTQLNGNRYVIRNVTANTFELLQAHVYADVTINSTAYGAYTSGGTAQWIGIWMPYDAVELPDVRYAQTDEVATFVHDIYNMRELVYTSDTAWDLFNYSVGPSLSAPTGVVATPTGTGTITYEYKVSALNEDGRESLPSSSASCVNATPLSDTVYNTITWNAVSGAARYLVYKKEGGSFGYIGTADALTFRDTNFDADTKDAPLNSINPFDNFNYPTAVEYYQQRMFFGGLSDDSQRIEASAIGAHHDFSTSYPYKDNQAFSLSIDSKKVNEVKHLLSQGVLLVFTHHGVWKLDAGDLGFAVQNIKADRIISIGSSDVAPIDIVDSVVFLSRGSNVVHDLYLSEKGYSSNNKSILASHLFENGETITDWAYAESPYSIIWAVRSDGVLLGLTYVRDQNVWAWHRHTTDGFFESVAVANENNEDVLYAVVRRTINAATVRYVERMIPRKVSPVEDCFFVDCGITYSGASTTTITGLSHLEGKTVAVLGNGNVMNNKVVTGGQITLEEACTKVQVGLPYTCDIETLRPSIPNEPILSRQKNVSEVSIQVKDTRGVSVGPDSTELIEIKQRTTEMYGSAIALFTGIQSISITPEWNDRGSVFIRQSYPLPATVLSIMPEVTIGG